MDFGTTEWNRFYCVVGIVETEIPSSESKRSETDLKQHRSEHLIYPYSIFCDGSIRTPDFTTVTKNINKDLHHSKNKL